MLDNCLTASEWSRNRCHTAFCDREKRIDNTLTCNQRHLRRQLLLIRTALSYRPSLHHRELLVSLRCGEYGNRLLHCKGTGTDLLYSSLYIRRHHNFLLYDNRFLNSPKHVAAFHFVSYLCNRDKFPFLISFQRRNFYSTFQAVSTCRLHNIVERSLDPIVDTCDQSRSKLYGHRHIHGFYRLPRFESCRLFVYLYRSLITVDLDDLAD